MVTTEAPLLGVNQLETCQDFSRARSRVLELEGMEHYLPEEQTRELVEKAIDQMVEQVTLEIDSAGMKVWWGQLSGWSEKETEEYFSHNNRQLYKSELKLSEDAAERKEQMIVIGNYLRLNYERLRDSKARTKTVDKAKNRLREFFAYAFYDIFAEPAFAIDDEIIGLNPADRQLGELKTNPERIKQLRVFCEQVVEETETELSPEKLFEEVMLATEGGNLSTTWSYLTGNSGLPEVRRVLEKEEANQVKGQDRTVRELQLVWETVAFSMEMGVDQDLIYEINNLPTGDKAEEEIGKFMNREELVLETWKLLQAETPNVLKMAVESGEPIDVRELLQERAENKGFSGKVESEAELNKKIQFAEGLMRQLLPLVFREAEFLMVEYPYRLGSITRDYNLTLHNRDKQLLKAQFVNPRNELDIFLTACGHERLGHLAHTNMIQLGVENGKLPKSVNWNKIPDPIKEEMAILVEQQLKLIKNRDEQADNQEAELKKTESPEVVDTDSDTDEEDETKGMVWADLYLAFLYRRQAPKAVAQRQVRLLMEQRWLDGKRKALTNKEADEIATIVNPMITRWYGEGLPLMAINDETAGNINMTDPLDGIKYIADFFDAEEPASLLSRILEMGASLGAGVFSGLVNRLSKEKLSLKKAFEKEFGEIWFDNPKARAVYLALLVETGENHKTKTYPGFVARANPKGIIEEFGQWGIEDEI